MAKDPICGMYVDENTAAITRTIHGTKWYFCSDTCAKTFERPEIELKRLKLLVVVGLVFTAPIILLTYLTLLPTDVNNYLLFLLETPVQFIVGWRFYRGAYDALRNRVGNMDLLIAIGTTAAWAYSTIVVFLPTSFPAGGIYFDTAAVIITLILLGNLLEQISRARASLAVRKLLDLQPRIAHIIRDGVEIEVPVESVKVDEDTVLAKIVQLVEEAQMAQAPIQRIADKISGYFVPAVILIATGAAVGWHFFGGLPLNFATLAFVSVIVIACPCALGIATPAAILVGTAKGAQNGILIKNGGYLETAHKLQTIVFDKTGTLTRGKPSVTDVITTGNHTETELL